MREEVLSLSLSSRCSPTHFDVKPRRVIPHVRQLRLEWSDGAEWQAHLEHGFGFLRPRGYEAFAFDRPAADQVTELDRHKFEILRRTDSPTYFYLSEVKAPR
jgi:hypothetical protein